MSEGIDLLQALPGLLPRTVSARGEGSVDVAPDAARISAGVYVTRASLKKAREDAARQADAAIAAARGAGIPKSDLQTSGFTVLPQRNVESKTRPAAIVGYDVRNTVTITVRDLEHLPEVLDAVIAAGANQIAGPEFFIQHPEAAEDEARRLAVASARRRAEVLAKAANATLGRVHAIRDGGLPVTPAPRMMRAMAADSAAPTPIEAGTERIAASVEVVWELA